MSNFRINGNINATNVQNGDYNTMHIEKQIVEIDWKTLEKSFLEIDWRELSNDDKKLLFGSLDCIKREDKNGIKKIIKSNCGEFVKNICYNLAASGLIEIIKVML